MKYLKRYNEDIDWNFQDEEEDENEFDFDYHLKNDYPIKVYLKDWDIFKKDVLKKTNINLQNFADNANFDDNYIYIYIYDQSYLKQQQIEKFLSSFEYFYNIDKVVVFNKK